MPANIAPTTYLTGYNGDDGKISVSMDSATDIRKIMHELVQEAYVKLGALPAADRPTKFTITKSVPTGVNISTIRQSYTLSFDFDTSGIDVANEA